MFLSSRRYPTRKEAIKGLMIFYIWYMFWIYFGKIYANVWPYKFMNLMNPFLVVAFNTVMGIYIFLFYLAGELLNKKLWSKRLNAELRNRASNDE
jgi:hypothetical protein